MATTVEITIDTMMGYLWYDEVAIAGSNPGLSIMLTQYVMAYPLNTWFLVCNRGHLTTYRHGLPSFLK